MIEINLLPEDLRAKAESRRANLNVEVKYFVYLVPLVLLVLLFVHVYLGVLFIAKNGQLAVLNRNWRSLEPERRQVETFNKENIATTQDTTAIKKLTDQRVLWSDKLHKLNDGVPAGIWFTELSATARDFTLKGCVVSLQKEEMGLIKKFIDNLKSNQDFFKNFNNLELSSVQRKTIGNYDVLDFTLVGMLK